MNETVVAIIEAFEDFLEEKGVVIPNDDKDQAIADGEDPEGIAIIYGTDFGNLYDIIEHILNA